MPAEPKKTPSSEDNARREFLKKAGRFAAVTPPAMTVLLGTTLSTKAIAGSSGDKPGYAFGTSGHYGPPGQGYTAAEPFTGSSPAETRSSRSK